MDAFSFRASTWSTLRPAERTSRSRCVEALEMDLRVKPVLKCIRIRRPNRPRNRGAGARLGLVLSDNSSPGQSIQPLTRCTIVHTFVEDVPFEWHDGKA